MIRDVAPPVDQKGRGQRLNRKRQRLPGNRLRDAVQDVVLLHEPSDLRAVALVQRHTDNGKPPTGVPVHDAYEVRCFSAARRAPGSPEVYQYDIAVLIPKAPRSTGQVSRRENGRGVSPPLPNHRQQSLIAYPGRVQKRCSPQKQKQECDLAVAFHAAPVFSPWNRSRASGSTHGRAVQADHPPRTLTTSVTPARSSKLVASDER